VFAYGREYTRVCMRIHIYFAFTMHRELELPALLSAWKDRTYLEDGDKHYSNFPREIADSEGNPWAKVSERGVTCLGSSRLNVLYSG
jgi:hypothetical protein